MTQRVLSCGCGIFKRWKTVLLNTPRSFSSGGPDRAAQTSSRSNAVKETHISKLLTLRSLNNSDKQSRKLVLLFDWLYAKPAAVEKYCKLYHDQGLDVLTINGRLAHFLWPPEGYKLAESILSYTLEEHKNDVIVHAFSVGAYLFTLCLMLSRREPEKYGAFRDKVKGQVFDSIVLGSYDHMSTGIAVALPGTNLMKKPILQMMDVYYNMTKETTRDEYDKLVDLFKVDPIMAPTLLFYSYNDPMCYVPSIEEMITNWHRDLPALDVTSKCWEKSIHAAHLKFHQEEYLNHWGAWMTKISQNS
ncbi:uncharacterized protein LOC110462574 [Mizuhopecten yessoensis]|uniref:Transmembrane protein 53-B n=1 Tax=Mizuhopecten yessoensis TaxID=6573 RepID=A0A210PY13_MIZYE|nr:uncharacterized protein LOC110462574 [Mizuhopecten yessoensis]OWF41380.1 Transmembrane protein 53-B [Mizuhopecten yessoensis]